MEAWIHKWLSLWGVFTTLHRDSGFFGQIVRIGMQKNTIYPPLRRTVYQVNQLQAVFFRSLFLKNAASSASIWP